MAWTIGIILLAVVMLGLFAAAIAWDDDDVGFLGCLAGILLVILGIVSIFGSADAYGKSLSAKNSGRVVALKTTQRDELIAGLRADMSTDEFAKLQTATNPDDITVIFGQGVSDFLISRAQTIVALNKELNELTLSIEQKKADVCTYEQNPFTPRVPFMLPDCDLEP